MVSVHGFRDEIVLSCFIILLNTIMIKSTVKIMMYL